MKKFLPLFLMLLLPVAAVAQTTMRLTLGGVAWLSDLSEINARTMPIVVSNVGDGYSISSEGFDLPAATTTLEFDNSTLHGKNIVDIDFSRSLSPVEAAKELREILEVKVAEGLIEISERATHTEEITYRLRGTFAGSVVLRGTYKAIVELHGVNITATGNTPALWVDNGKRIDLVAKSGTKNYFADAATNEKKAALFIKGHAELKGAGEIYVTGNARHAYASNEYTWVKDGFGTLVVTGAKSDGLHISQYLQMDGGKIQISGTAGDGIDVEYTYADENNTIIKTEDANNGEVMINGGTIQVTLASDDTKAVSSDSHMTIKGGTLNLTLNGNGTRGLGVGSKSKSYISNLLVEEAAPATAPTNITIEGSGKDSANETLRAVRVTGNATHNGGNILISLPNATKPIKVDGAKTGAFAK